MNAFCQRLTHWAGLAALCALTGLPLSAAHAERGDHDKEVHIEGDHINVDDKNKVVIFQGGAKLTQGTLVILSDKIVVTQDLDGFQKGVAVGGKGGLARFRQKRDGKDSYIEGEAERIEYDARTDTAQLFNRAKVLSGTDQAVGQYINYNGYTETYVITNGPNATVKAGDQSRATLVIQPHKNEAGTPPKAAASAPRQ